MTCTRCGDIAPFYYPIENHCLCWKCATLSVFELSDEGTLPPVHASVVPLPADTFTAYPVQTEEKTEEAV